MSTSFWILFLVIGGICGVVFAKTVSNDAKNDYKLRDILTNSNKEETESEVFTPQTKSAAETEEKPKPVHAGIYEEKNIYEEIAQEQQLSYSYTTNTHSTNNYTSPQSSKVEENLNSTPKYESEPVYYEKINDDACDIDEDEYIEEGYNEPKEFEGELKPKQNYAKTKKSSSLFEYVKTFWKGITFCIGMLVCIYSFYGIATQVQTSNDAIVFSIWLLIGVILIK